MRRSWMEVVAAACSGGSCRVATTPPATERAERVVGEVRRSIMVAPLDAALLVAARRVPRLTLTLTLTLLALCLHSLCALAQAAEPPVLMPPHGELPPSFWESQGWQVVLAGVVFFTMIVLGIFWLRRPKPVVVEAPVVVARRALEKLRGRPGKVSLDLEVSRILKRYVMAVLQLPPEELTTTELCGVLKSHGLVKPELAGLVGDFLRGCDEWKFSAAPTAPQLGAVSGALDLVEKIELSTRQRTSPQVVA